jgi:hypothetical protein
MQEYNLDEKSGFMGMFGGIKSASKVLKKDDIVDFKHYSSFNFVKASILDINENTIKIHLEEKFSEANVFPGDPIVFNFTNSQELYVIGGEIEQIILLDPFEAKIKACKIEKMKDSKKSQRYIISLAAEMKVVGISDNVFAAVKNISLGGIKMNCKVDILMEDITDVNLKFDKTNKLSFKGKIVRKNRIGDFFEYGVEIHDISETNLRNLHHFINQFEFGV